MSSQKPDARTPPGAPRQGERKTPPAPTRAQVLQPKAAGARPPAPQPPKPHAPNVQAKPKTSHPNHTPVVQPKRAPVAPPAYRPQPTPKVLQAKVKEVGPVAPAVQGARLITPARPAVVGVIQRRGYKEDSVIDKFITANRAAFVRGGELENGGTDNSVDVNALTELFKRTHQYHDRDDLRYLRNKVGKHKTPLKSQPSGVLTYPLAATFRAHVRGDSAGVGWHTESSHANGDAGYSYAASGWIAQSKGTYWATTLIINGTAKTGNNGNGTFFPATMSLDLIAEEAEYVANTYPPAGQLVIGRGRQTGIMIECILRLNRVESAYPFKPGW